MKPCVGNLLPRQTQDALGSLVAPYSGGPEGGHLKGGHLRMGFRSLGGRFGYFLFFVLGGGAGEFEAPGWGVVGFS